MKIIIDRIEGAFAVAELPDMSTINVPLALLPGAKEGDVYLIEKDEATTAETKNRIQDKFNQLRSDE